MASDASGAPTFAVFGQQRARAAIVSSLDEGDMRTGTRLTRFRQGPTARPFWRPRILAASKPRPLAVLFSKMAIDEIAARV